MKRIYVLIISTVFAFHTIRPSEPLLSLSIQDPVPTANAQHVTPSRTKTCLKKTCVGTLCLGLVLGGGSGMVALTQQWSTQSTPPPTPTPYPACNPWHDYFLAYAHECNSNCPKGFAIGLVCPLPASEDPSIISKLKVICPESKEIKISTYSLCTVPPQAPCTPLESALQKLNATCSLPTAEQPTLSLIRQKHQQNLTEMALQRKPQR